MKTTINGIEIEGTPEEILFFVMREKKKELDKQNIIYSCIVCSKPSVKPRCNSCISEVKKDNKNKGSYPIQVFKKWSEEEDKELKTYYPYRNEHLLAPKLGRTVYALQQRAYKLGIKRIVGFNHPIAPLPNLLKAQEIVQRSSFPKFDSVKDGFGSILERMVHNVIQQSGKLTFSQDGIALGFNSVIEWGNFAREFMTKSKEISVYFGCENKFKYDGYWIIYQK